MPKKPIKPKDPLDRFYTNPEVAELCYNKLLPYIIPTDLLIEPSGGNGSFFSLMRNPKIAYDLDPQHPDIIKADFLKQEIPKNCIIIGNPPFGTRNKLSKAFIRHCIPHAKTIAFILPKVFQKETVQKVFPRQYHLVLDYTLPKNAFHLNGNEYSIPTTFQIWTRTQSTINLRKSVQPKQTTTDFIFTNHNATHFIFGAAPNKIIKPEEVQPNNRGYYIQSNVENIEEVFKNIDWKSYGLSSVSGNVAWFSKQEIIDAYVINNQKPQ